MLKKGTTAMVRRLDWRSRMFLGVAVVALSGSAFGENTIRGKSPGEVHEVVVSRNDDGAVLYAVTYRGKAILRPSRLGLRFKSQPDLASGLVFGEEQRRHYRGKLESRLAERSSVEFEWNELQLPMSQPETGRTLRVVFRIFDDAIAFRYEIPAQDKLEEYTIAGELTEFGFSAQATAYTEYGHEGEYVPKPMALIRKGCWLPLLVRDGNAGLSHVVLQADAWDYPRRFVLSQGSPGFLGVTLQGNVEAQGAYRTPWHVVTTAESDTKLIELNYIRDALVDDRLPEPDWIVPGKAIRLVDLKTSAGIEGVDFAAENGLQYVEYDAGWYGDQGDPESDATTSIRGLDVEAVCKYGATKGVGVILYVNKLHLELQSDKIFPKYREWGVRGLKFGFVDGRTQAGIANVHRWAQLALEHEMIVDVHDNYRPSGMSQRLPNLLTQEGIRGNEWRPTSRHNTTLPFTRFVAGAGDYTFCYPGGGKTTNVHQLALSVVCFSPLQFPFWYGRPRDYKDSLGKGWFKIVPTTWDETHVVTGEVGEHYAVARRQGSDWYLGGITNESARTLELRLDFLKAGETYQAKVYRDADGKELHIDTRDVTSETTLSEELHPNGGVAIVLRPSA